MSPLALESLGVQRLLRCRSLVGTLVLRACYVTARPWEPWCSELVTYPFAVGSLSVTVTLPRLGVKTLSCHRSLLGAFVFKDCYVAARSWESWC
eukprot:2260166-Pyramimonas_sp.AAC.1